RLEPRPGRSSPGCGCVSPGADGRENGGMGVGWGPPRRQVALREDLARFCALLATRGDIGPGVRPGPVPGGWLRMGGTGTPAAAGDVLLAGDAAGPINPPPGGGVAPAMGSGRLAAASPLAPPPAPRPPP